MTGSYFLEGKIVPIKPYCTQKGQNSMEFWHSECNRENSSINVKLFIFSVIEFKDAETAALAIDKMHRYEVRDRKLVVREVTT